MAATTNTKIWTGSLNAPGRALQHLKQRHTRRQRTSASATPSSARRHLLHGGDDTLAWNATRHMDDLRQWFVSLHGGRGGIGHAGKNLPNGITATGEAD